MAFTHEAARKVVLSELEKRGRLGGRAERASSHPKSPIGM